MEMFRSATDLGDFATGKPRHQLNSITAFIDASNVYGSDDKLNEDLRRDATDDAMLATSAGNMLPFRTDGTGFLAGTPLISIPFIPSQTHILTLFCLIPPLLFYVFYPGPQIYLFTHIFVSNDPSHRRYPSE